MLLIEITYEDEFQSKEISSLVEQSLKKLQDLVGLICISAKVKQPSILVKTKQGEKNILLSDVNYICIEGRYLSYHLSNEIIHDAHVLRTSFAKILSKYIQYKDFMFIKPSLLFNLKNIQTLDKDKIIFKNNEILYYPQKYYEEIQKEWLK